MLFLTKTAPGAAGYAPDVEGYRNTSVVVATSTDGRIFYTWWELGEEAGAREWRELEGDGRTDAAPAASFQILDLGASISVFSAIKGLDLDSNLYSNVGKIDGTFVGWTQLLGLQTHYAPAATASNALGESFPAIVATTFDQRIFYFYEWSKIGEGVYEWRELEGNGRTDGAPAAALVADSSYLFVVVKGLDGQLYLNQGVLGQQFNGWQPMGFTTTIPPAATSAGNTSVVVAISTDYRIFYTWWEHGEEPREWRELEGNGLTDAAPAAALVGDDNTHLFVVIKTLLDPLYVNEGELGQRFGDWRQL